MSTKIKVRERTRSKKNKKIKPRVEKYNDDIFSYDPRDYDGFDDSIDEEE